MLENQDFYLNLCETSLFVYEIGFDEPEPKYGRRATASVAAYHRIH